MYTEIIINKPVILEDSVLYSMPKDEINTLASLLKYSDVVINLFSTLNLEATIFDKPIVNVCFEGDSYTGPPRARYNIFIDERQTHNQRVIVDKGLKIAYNQQELIIVYFVWVVASPFHRLRRNTNTCPEFNRKNKLTCRLGCKPPLLA